MSKPEMHVVRVVCNALHKVHVGNHLYVPPGLASTAVIVSEHAAVGRPFLQSAWTNGHPMDSQTWKVFVVIQELWKRLLSASDGAVTSAMKCRKLASIQARCLGTSQQLTSAEVCKAGLLASMCHPSHQHPAWDSWTGVRAVTIRNEGTQWRA
jgi:hypothetical protein